MTRYDIGIISLFLSDLIRDGKSNSDICKEFGIAEDCSSLCERCDRIREELNKSREESKNLSTNKEVNKIKVSGLTKVCSEPTKPVEDVSSGTEELKSEPSGVVDNSLSDIISSCKSNADELHSHIKRRFIDGFSDTELKELDTYISGIKGVVAKLEDIQFLFDNIKVFRKGN